MSECSGNNFILNGELNPAELFDSKFVYEGESVYEVIRLMKGRPLFFLDHMDRLISSIRNRNHNMLADASILTESINKLANLQRAKDINIKIVFNYNNGSYNWLVYFVESSYPTADQYNNGVKGILFKAERKDPVSKTINNELRSEINNRLICEDRYEALLVNSYNLITEGSGSNVFFIRNNILVTAPDNLILKGITRKHILEICVEKNIEVKLECVNADDISGYEAAFITGTSPMVLPYCCIEDVRFNVKLPIIKELNRLYILRAEESIKHFSPEY
jgi:branched-chain amino acid aminotransferase